LNVATISVEIILLNKMPCKPDKGKAEHLYSALHGIQTTLKCSGMDHTINTIPAFTS